MNRTAKQKLYIIFSHIKRNTRPSSHTSLHQQILIMCFYKRIVSSCGHVGRGAQIIVCEQQTAYEERHQTQSCPDMLSHPFHSLKVQTLCRRCHQMANKSAQTARKLAQVKVTMGSLNETILKLRTGEQTSLEDTTQLQQLSMSELITYLDSLPG